MVRPMTPGIELAESIEQAQILVIVHTRDILGDRTAQRYHAQPLCPFGGKGLDRIVDLKRPLAVQFPCYPPECPATGRRQNCAAAKKTIMTEKLIAAGDARFRFTEFVSFHGFPIA